MAKSIRREFSNVCVVAFYCVTSTETGPHLLTCSIGTSVRNRISSSIDPI